jgi:hypothetical protein
MEPLVRDGHRLQTPRTTLPSKQPFTAKEQNDPSGLTIWGVFRVKDENSPGGAEPDQWGHVWQGAVKGKRRIMLVHAWRKHLPFSGPRIDKEPQETKLASACPAIHSPCYYPDKGTTDAQGHMHARTATSLERGSCAMGSLLPKRLIRTRCGRAPPAK